MLGPSDLPDQVMQAFVSAIRNDRETLRAISLVCWDWLAITRKYLFEDISISNRTYDKFLALIGSPPVVDFTLHVHSLTLTEVKVWYGAVQSHEWVEETLLVCGEFLTNLKSLVLRSIQISSVTEWMLLSDYPLLTILKLSNTTVLNFDTALEIIHAHPLLETLTILPSPLLGLGATESLEGHGLLLQPPPLGLRNIQLSGGPTTTLMLRWLVYHKRCHNIESVQIQHIDDPILFNQFLTEAGPSLRLLALGFASFEPISDLASNPTGDVPLEHFSFLDHTTNIQSLHFYGRTIAAFRSRPPTFVWIHTFLQLVSPSIEYLQFTSGASTRTFGMVDWALLDETIFPRFTKLKKVEITLVIPVEEPKRNLEYWEDMLLEALGCTVDREGVTVYVEVEDPETRKLVGQMLQ